MLGSRRLYRAIRIVLGILTILSMLGISVNIFADGVSVIENMSLFTHDIYENLSEDHKNFINNNKDSYNFIYYNPNTNTIMCRNITEIVSEDNTSISYKAPGPYIQLKDGVITSGNVSQNNQNFGFGNSKVYKFVFDGANYQYKHITTIIVDLNVIGHGSVVGSGTYNYDDYIQIKAIPDEDYIFVGWFHDEGCLDYYSNQSVIVFNNAKEEIGTLYAQFIPKDSDNPLDPVIDDPTENVIETETFKYLTAISIVVCMIYWNSVIKEYL